jgi:hypothetical protein
MQQILNGRGTSVPSAEPGISDLIYRPPMSQDWRDAWHLSEAEIEIVEQNVRAHGALFLAVVVGTGIQVLASNGYPYLRSRPHADVGRCTR